MAGLNILSPLVSLQVAFSNLCSLGAATISAQYMGDNRQEDAKQIFSKIVFGTIVIGGLFSLVINLFSTPILSFLGADEELYGYAIYQIRFVYSTYGKEATLVLIELGLSMSSAIYLLILRSLRYENYLLSPWIER